MQRWYNVVVMWLVLLFISGCSDRSIPRREPVGDSSLIASTNCVEVGDTVTFTINLQNLSGKTTTIAGTPPFDVTVTPVKWDKLEPAPLVRWSATDRYPINPATVLVAGEQRTYTWQWQATQEFAQVKLRDKNIKVTFSRGMLQTDDGPHAPSGETHVFIGVNTYYSSTGWWQCSEMTQ